MKQKTCEREHLDQGSQGVSGFHFCDAEHRALFNLVILGAVLAIFLFGVPPAHAQLTILHSFGDGSVPNDGGYPEDGLIQAPDGNFYGVTLFHASGDPKGGTIFQMTASGTLKIVESYGHPYLTYAPFYYNKELIGYYFGRDKQHPGVIFSLTGYPSGPWRSHVWYVFASTPGNGPGPAGRLILGSDGNLYGVTSTGGSANEGTIYRVNPKNHEVKIVYSFTGSSLVYPISSLLLAADGNYYGGAVPAAAGQIYKMTPSGDVTTFYQFSAGESPSSPLIQGSDGNFYGTAGISSDALVYQLTTSGVFTVLHTFSPTNKNSVFTFGVVQGPNGYLYGLTDFDGTAGKGTVYEVSTDGSIFNVLHNFGDGSVPNDGADPDGILTLGTDGNLYGVTPLGGSANQGTVFKISP